MTYKTAHHISEEQHKHVHGDSCQHEHEEHHDENGSESGDDHDDDAMILNRNEKKARKTLSKLGMKLVTGIERVTIKRSRVVFAITNPTVYKLANDSYIVFGEAKVEDSGFQAQAMAAQRMAQANAQRQAMEAQEGDDKGKDKDEEGNGEGEGEEEEVDATGVDDKDVRIVMEQTSVSRSKAIKALKDNNNDIVNTIMELTM